MYLSLINVSLCHHMTGRQLVYLVLVLSVLSLSYCIKHSSSVLHRQKPEASLRFIFSKLNNLCTANVKDGCTPVVVRVILQLKSLDDR